MTCSVGYNTAGFLLAAAIASYSACAETLPTHNAQGATHAYLMVRTEDGRVIGTGDSVNQQTGHTWSSRLTLRFHDGSLDDDTTVYTQGKVLHVISDHHVQKGPSFPKPMDMTVNAATHTVIWHEVKDGKDEVKSESIDVPNDLMNGMMPWVLQNLPHGQAEVTMSYLASTPKPRLIKLSFHKDGSARFRIGYASKSADMMRMHVELGGVAGVVAPLIGKQPPDMHAWVVPAPVPTFLKFQTYLYMGGPMLNIELSSPVWPTSRE